MNRHLPGFAQCPYKISGLKVMKMGLYDRDYMRSRDNSGRDPEWKDDKVSRRNTIVIVIAIIMILIFVLTYVI